MTDDLVIGLRKRRDQGSKMAAARIEQDAARIARLEGECRESAMDALLAYGQATDAYEAQLKAEAKVAALEWFAEISAEQAMATKARAAIAAAKGGNIDSEDRKGGE